MKKLVVLKKYDGNNLITFLQNNFDGLTSSTIYKSLRKKDILVNGIRMKENVKVFENDEITIYITDDLLFKDIDIKKIYEDDNILVVFKPSGIEVVSETSNSLTSILARDYNYISPCHRLDRNTKGLVLFAKNEKALGILFEKFRNHEIKKHYKCLVYGMPKKASETLEAYLFKDNKKSQVYISDVPRKGYAKIATSYRLLEKYSNNTSLLEVELLTGKTHQIRAHLAHIGLPIIGDGKYGNYEINKKFKKTTQELTAYKICFDFKTGSDQLDYLNGKTIFI